MDVRIAQPLGYSELGGRSNNEDSIFPDPLYVSPRQKWFLVCDGVGGAERGEVASRLAATSLDAFLQQRPVAVATDEYLQQAVAYVEDQFNAYFVENPQALGMATTLTLLYIHEAGATVAHIGDSRVYHVRDGRVIWRTDDHSYVNELVRGGVITPVEALRHPQRNIITRALQGGERPVHPSVQVINDLRPGDYFFLCSDGVLERVSDELLEGTLHSRTDTNEQKLAKLRDYSYGNTRDNFTAYLIQIDQVMGTVDPAYQVESPVYERYATDTEADEAITLINVPIPDSIKVEPAQVSAIREVPSSQAPYATQAEPMAAVRSETAETERSAVRPVAATPVRRSKRWLVPVLTVVGAVIGAGGIYVWQQFNGKKAGTHEPDKSITQDIPPANGLTVASNAPGKANQPDGSQTEPSDGTNTASTSAGLSVGADGDAFTGANVPANATYKVVEKVDDALYVVKDTKTNLLGLRKPNGQWPAHKIYKEIGSFENGIAEVRTDKGPEKYLSKEGKKFRSFSNYEDGVATLVGVDGRTVYLSKNGDWIDEMKPARNNRIAIRQDNHWGYLNMQGQKAIFVQYDKATSFRDDGTAEVTLQGKTFRIDLMGEKVTEKDSPRSASKNGKEKKG